MDHEMNDREFLRYCDTHAESPRCGFVPAHIARLLRLAGQEEPAAEWEAVPNQVINCQQHTIQEIVALALARLDGPQAREALGEE